jgi:predicted house-cleaning noncanonical NTP pyrophosphatase (MazG superfamily)
MSVATDTVLVLKVSHDKLVRDRIPEIIRAAGRHPVTRILDQPSYRAALLDKLVEEAQETRQAPDEQLADVLEVLQAIAAVHDLPWERIQQITAAKRAERGAFDSRVFLEYVEEPA